MLYERLMKMPELAPYVEGHQPERVYAGYWQKSQGAWSWCIGTTIGSQWTMKSCVDAKELEIYHQPNTHDIHINPKQEPQT